MPSRQVKVTRILGGAYQHPNSNKTCFNETYIIGQLWLFLSYMSLKSLVSYVFSKDGGCFTKHVLQALVCCWVFRDSNLGARKSHDWRGHPRARNQGGVLMEKFKLYGKIYVYHKSHTHVYIIKKYQKEIYSHIYIYTHIFIIYTCY